MLTPDATSDWTASATAALAHVETRPDIAFPLLAIATPLFLFGALAYIVVKFILPAWREEKEADRKALGAEITGFRELGKAQQGAIVERIESELLRNSAELAKLHERTERHGAQLAAIAAKLGVIALLMLCSGLCGFGAVRSRRAVAAKQWSQQRHVAEEDYSCDPGCPSGQHCCANASGRKCCNDSTIARPPQRRSALPLRALASYADGDCAPQIEACYKCAHCGCGCWFWLAMG